MATKSWIIVRRMQALCSSPVGLGGTSSRVISLLHLTEVLCGGFVNCGCHDHREQVAAVSHPDRVRSDIHELWHLPSPYSFEKS